MTAALKSAVDSAIDDREKAAAEFRVAYRAFAEARVVSTWATADANRLRKCASELEPGSRLRIRVLTAALCRVEEGELALRACESAARRIGPILDRLIGGEARIGAAILAELDGDREDEA